MDYGSECLNEGIHESGMDYELYEVDESDEEWLNFKKCKWSGTGVGKRRREVEDD